MNTDTIPVGAVDFGSFRRLSSISSEWGYDRGTPVDRYYIEKFIGESAGDISGQTLEAHDRSYTRRFGGDRPSKMDVLSVSPKNPLATVVADLSNAPQIQDDSYNCIILTQTLPFIYDVQSAVRTLHRILRPNGVALVTVPGICKSSWNDAEGYSSQWHFNVDSTQRVFSECFSQENVKIETRGNVLASVAFLHGLAAEELNQQELDYKDGEFPVIIAIRAQKIDEANS